MTGEMSISPVIFRVRMNVTGNMPISPDMPMLVVVLRLRKNYDWLKVHITTPI